MSEQWQSYLRAQRAYDRQCPPDDEPTTDCEQCGEEFAFKVDSDGDVESFTCAKCAEKENE